MKKLYCVWMGSRWHGSGRSTTPSLIAPTGEGFRQHPEGLPKGSIASDRCNVAPALSQRTILHTGKAEMKMLQVQAYVPTHTYGGAPITAAELKRMPSYPKSLGAEVTKLRKLPRTPHNVQLLGDAIGEGVRALQRREFHAGLREPGEDKCPCASGTWHDDGHKILAAVNARIKGAMSRALEADHSFRTDHQVGVAYRAAMAGTPIRGLVSSVRNPK